MYGYSIVNTFATVAGKAGKSLTTDSFIKVMDSTTIQPDMFGSPLQTFTASKRLGSGASRLSQITDGKWKVVSDYVGDMPAKK